MPVWFELNGPDTGNEYKIEKEPVMVIAPIKQSELMRHFELMDNYFVDW
jgi:hypothetical protein